MVTECSSWRQSSVRIVLLLITPSILLLSIWSQLTTLWHKSKMAHLELMIIGTAIGKFSRKMAILTMALTPRMDELLRGNHQKLP